MSGMKKLGVLVAVFALCAVGTASASAAEFTTSATGELEGHATANQVFTFNGGNLTCTKADSKVPINKTSSTDWTAGFFYTNCTAFGFATVDVSEWKWTLTSNGRAHKLNTSTITVTLFGVSICTLTVGGGQEVGTVGYANAGTSNVTMTPNVTGITYTSSGGSCGSSGSNGTYTGASEINRVGGGTVRFDP